MKKRLLAWMLLLVLPVLLLASCGSRTLSPEEEALCGRWAYNHDPDTPVLTLKKNGCATFKGAKYDYACDDQFIHLRTGKGDDLDLRYQLTDDGMILYIPAEYECEGTTDGLVGFWRCAPQNLSFDFTADGAFSEDGVFTGNYTADEAAGTFTLHYAEYFDDTTCYYTLDGAVLTVDYPWPMVPAK